MPDNPRAQGIIAHYFASFARHALLALLILMLRSRRILRASACHFLRRLTEPNSVRPSPARACVQLQPHVLLVHQELQGVQAAAQGRHRPHHPRLRHAALRGHHAGKPKALKIQHFLAAT